MLRYGIHDIIIIGGSMKKIILFIIILLIPIMIQAKSCDKDCIIIESVSLVEKTDNASEANEPSYESGSLSLDVKLGKVYDNLKYKVVIKNNTTEDYELDKNSFNSGNEYVSLVYSTSNNSNTIKAGETQTIFLEISYNKLIKDTNFVNGVYKFGDNFTIQLTSNILEEESAQEVPNGKKAIVVNPNTKTGKKILIVLIVFALCAVIALLIKYLPHQKRFVSVYLILIGIISIIPIVRALNKITINITLNVEIDKINYMPCTFDGDMVQGTEFAYGDFIYRYKQEYKMNKESDYNWFLEWVNINEDGWGVIYKDIDSDVEGELTPKMCSSINGKPIVSMSYTFYFMSKITKIDLSYIDTSNVVNMDSTLYYMGGDVYPEVSYDNVKFEMYGLENWDVSNVKNMDQLFYGVGRFTNDITISDYSNWDTSNVENMDGMFYLVGQGYESTTSSNLITDTKLHINGFENWNVSKVKIMCYMFSYLGATAENVYLDLSNWDTSNVENMEGMFEQMGDKSKSVVIKGLDKWNVSKVKYMGGMFDWIGNYNAEEIDIGDLSNWDVSNAEDMSYMFSGFNNRISNPKFFDISKWDTRNVKNMSNMFSFFGEETDKVINIGTLNIYANDINYIFYDAPGINATVNAHTNLSSSSNYSSAFREAATIEGSLIKVNYSRDVTNIDSIIATKSNNSNVIKGELLD